MPRGGPAAILGCLRRPAIGFLPVSIAVLALIGPAAASDPPDAFRRLVDRVMLQPRMKKDTAKDHINYSTRTPVFAVPTDPAKAIDAKDPSTFMTVFAEVTLTDKEPLALTPEALGAEDVLLVVLRTEGTGHIFWKYRDAGLKGPGEAASKELVPLFGEEPRAKYKDVVDRINAALDAEAAAGQAK
jgi:hypothetical protein